MRYLPTQQVKKRRGNDFFDALWGTLKDPIGTLVSVARHQPPSWLQRGSGREVPLRVFDIRKSSGPINVTSHILNKAFTKYRKTGTMTIDPADMAMISPTKYWSRDNNNNVFTYRRKSGLFDTILSMLTSPTARNLAKRIGISAASSALPAVASWTINKLRGRNNKNGE